MVEAVGFEPTSENRQPEAHTCLSPHFKLSPHPPPQGELRNRPARLVSSLRPGRNGKTSPNCDIPSAAQAAAGRRVA